MTLLDEMKADIPPVSKNHDENLAYNKDRTYNHLHDGLSLSMAGFSDMEIGGIIRMMTRNDWGLEAKVVAARDRIYCLVKEKSTLEKSLRKLIEQIDMSDYKTKDGFHDLKMNRAFVDAKKLMGL